MMTALKPSVFRHRDSIQLSYEHCHSVYDTHVYPRQSSNGSTVIVYGTENGVRVVWYAGRRFKKPSQPAPKVNGSAKDDPMVIDLDDDDGGPEVDRDGSQPAEFESEQDEVDPAEPYAHVLRSLDIPLGTTALNVAIPPLPMNISDMSDDSYPSIFKSTMVVAAACTDLSIRLITLPLTPPKPEITDISKCSVNIIKLFGRGFHQDLISSIAISHTIDLSDASPNTEQSRSRSRNRTQPTNSEDTQSWSIMVASTSCTGSGLLLIHQIPIIGNSQLSSDTSNFAPISRQFLRTSVLSAKLSFNPSWYPSPRHSNLLLTLPDAGCVKVYQIHFQQTAGKGRGVSTATTDSASSTRSFPNVGSQTGRFLLTLVTEYASHEGPTINPRRKKVLDSKWIIGGRAIIVLTEDGEWGIWDLEAVGPVSSSTHQNPIKGRGNISGVQGGASTQFAARGTVLQSSTIPKTQNTNQSPSTGSMVPATPHTRKVRAEGLFKGTVEQDDKPTTGNSEGCIAVLPSVSTRNDESVIINYNEYCVYYPSIQASWKSETSGRGSFDTGNPSRPIRLPALRTGGERIHDVILIPQPSKHHTDNQFGPSKPIPNFVASTDTRIILFVAPLSEESTEDSTNTISSTNPFTTIKTTDQALLRHGELDIDGMDRILDGMNGTSKSKPFLSKNVGFQFDDDTEMASPTPGKLSRLQPDSSKAPPRRLFS